MNLDEIIMRAIPISSRDCSINKAQKERMRRELKGRIEELLKAEREIKPGNLYTVPKVDLETVGNSLKNYNPVSENY